MRVKKLIRIGEVQRSIMRYLAQNPASYPWKIVKALGREKNDSPVYKAINTLVLDGFLRIIEDPTDQAVMTGRIRSIKALYSLSEEGWRDFEAIAINDGTWTIALSEQRDDQLGRRKTQTLVSSLI
jgi:DNA-binding PadR family transcriptional regulator